MKSSTRLTFQLLLIGLAFFAACYAKAGPLNEAITLASMKYNVDPKLMRAIAYLESSGGKFSALRKNNNGTYDVGPWQINSVHWATTCRAYDVATTQGNAYCAALLLSKHKKYKGIDVHWAARYHSKTPSKKVKYSQKLTKVLAAQSDK